MFYVYNDRTAKITDPYTIPGNIQVIENKDMSVEDIMKRTKDQMYSNNRTVKHDLKTSHYYTDVSSVRNPKELYRALRQMGSNTTQAEASILFRAYPDNLGGFDFRKFGNRLVCNDLDRRKVRDLDRVLVPDSRRTNVYAVRSLPSPSAQTNFNMTESSNAPIQRDIFASSLPLDHPLSPNAKSLLAAGEADSKMQFPHSLPHARVDTHEALQRYPRLASPSHVLRSHADPLGSRSIGDHACHVSSSPLKATKRPKSSVFVTDTERALGRTGEVRPATTGTFSGSRSAPLGSPASERSCSKPAVSYTGVGLNNTGKEMPTQVARGLWSHSPVPDAEGRRVRKHHPSSHKIAQLHHLAYRPMIRAAPLNM